MKNIFEQSAHKARTEVRLEPHEKVQVREVLFAYMEKHPHTKMKELSWYAPFALVFKKPVIAVALCLTLVTGVGTSYAAESALPGDVLYPIKVNINENVHDLVLFSDEAKAQWELERANRRLTELEVLKTRGKLTEDLQQKVEERYVFFEEKAQKRIERLQSQGKIESVKKVQERLSNAQQKHEKMKEFLKEKSERIKEKYDDKKERLLDQSERLNEKKQVKQSRKKEITDERSKNNPRKENREKRENRRTNSDD